MNPDRCMFSVKCLSNRLVCSLVKSAECDGTLHGKMRCPFWNVSYQLCRMGGRKA